MRDYEALAPSWNRVKPKWLAFLRLILSQPVEMMEMLNGYSETFSLDTASAIFGVIFPALGIVLEDKQDMSINVIIRGTLTKIQAEMINAGLLIPHPAGVTMTYEIPETLVSTDIIVQAGVYQAGQISFTSIPAS